MLPGIAIREEDVTPIRQKDCQVFTLVSGTNYAEPMIMRAIHWVPGPSQSRSDPQHDEYLYVMEGVAQVSIGEDVGTELAEGFAVQIPAGVSWRLDVGPVGLRVMSFLVPSPSTPWAASLAKDVSAVRNVSQLGAQSAQVASSDRQFEVLFDVESGSRGATMFVGFIPTSGAPEHYHVYDELCCIVRGSGFLHSNGQAQPISRGSAFHVAPRLLHSIENPNPEDLWILGVFRPEGSAAAAFYPDGRPAPTNTD